MQLKYSLKIALEGLQTNKSRSGLTILGIVIGITSIILIMSIGTGAENLILNEISGFGAEVIVVRPGKEPTGPTDFADTLFADSLKQRDVDALKKKSNVPDIVEVAPTVIVTGSVSYQGETFRPTTLGGSAEFMGKMLNIFPEEGVFFGEAEIRNRASVAVIGSKVKEELFGDSDALGENIKLKGRNFRVVGVLPEKGQTPFFNVNEIVIIPYTTAQQYLLGINHFHEILTRVDSPESVDRTVKDIEITLRQLHGIDDPDKDDFFVVTQQGIVDQIKTIIGVLTAFLGAVVAISLVVGGIGVMNIMLVSVTERTREIGLRKAIGATNKDIMTQFLLEAVILTVTGGVIGSALGVILSLGASFALSAGLGVSWQFIFPISAVILGVGVAAFVGLIFGSFPARQASLKSPIEALRYE